MSEKIDKKSAATLAKTLAMMCVRNTILEEFHCGLSPVSKTGDYTDVKVVDAEGEIPWNELARLNDREMRALMKQVVNRLYTFFLMAPDYYFSDTVHRWANHAEKWDAPELDETFLKMIDEQKARLGDRPPDKPS
jgi:hypothetical protein